MIFDGEMNVWSVFEGQKVLFGIGVQSVADGVRQGRDLESIDVDDWVSACLQIHGGCGGEGWRLRRLTWADWVRQDVRQE